MVGNTPASEVVGYWCQWVESFFVRNFPIAITITEIR